MFRDFCTHEKSLPLFMTYDWLKMVSGDNWDIVLEEKNGEITGVLPFVTRKKWGLIFIDQPPLTPYGGIWIKYPDGQKYATRLSYEKEVYTSLLDKLPPCDSFVQKFYPGFTNWLPLYWKGYKQTTAYTYIIEDLTDLSRIFSEFKENVRREIRKAEKNITIHNALDAGQLYAHKVKTYNATGQSLNIPLEYVNNIVDFVSRKKSGELLEARDENGNVHASAIFVWDNKTTYYLFGSSNPENKNSGAMSLLMWEAIKRSFAKSVQFNFEGSMIEEVERFFRGFGARQVPYFIIRKTNSKILKIKEFLSGL